MHAARRGLPEESIPPISELYVRGIFGHGDALLLWWKCLESMGDDVLKRAVILIGLPLALTACANEPSTSQFLPTSALAAAPIEPSHADLPKKTMSDRVLAAIALERVTGLKPDPSRLGAPQ